MSNFDLQLIDLMRGSADLLVATPGRLVSLARTGMVDLNDTRFVVLDECDRMLNLGFFADIKEIYSKMSFKRK
jgi:ATP-dependent RNA helicase RhlE